MAYKLKEVTIRTNNSDVGIEMIGEIWADITSGKLPLLFDSERVFQQGISPISKYSNYSSDESGDYDLTISPISKYSNYSSDESGDYDLTIMAVTADFFKEMELAVSKGLYKKYDEKDEDGDIGVCTRKAWEKVWHDQKSGEIKRSFTEDYESTVPSEYTKDGKSHCYLYIAIQ